MCPIKFTRGASEKKKQVWHARNVPEVKERKKARIRTGHAKESDQFRSLELRLFLSEGIAIEASWKDGAATLRGPYPGISNQPHWAVARGKTA